MGRPRISLVLPTRDGARYLDESIASVAAQTREDWELLVIDDGSRDATPRVAETWAARDARVRLLRLPGGCGLPAALNAGFGLARGALLGWTSDDNWYRPRALERLVAALDARPPADVVYAGYTELDAHGDVLAERPPRSADDLVLDNRIGPCFLYRREVHEALGGYDEDLALAEDYDFWLRASRRFRFRALDESLYGYRVHDGSLTACRRDDVAAACRRARDRHLAALPPAERGAALVRLAAADFAAGEPACGRRRLREALRLGRRPLLDAGLRWVWIDAVLGAAAGAWLRRRLPVRRPARAPTR